MHSKVYMEFIAMKESASRGRSIVDLPLTGKLKRGICVAIRPKRLLFVQPRSLSDEAFHASER